MFDIILCQDASPLEAISQSNRANQSAGCAICGSSFGIRTGKNSRYILTWEDLFWPVEFFQNLSLLSVCLIFSYIISKKCMRSSLVFHLVKLKTDSKVAKRISKVLSSRPRPSLRDLRISSPWQQNSSSMVRWGFPKSFRHPDAILSQWNPHYGWYDCFHLSLVWLVRSDGCITCNSIISYPSLSSGISYITVIYSISVISVVYPIPSHDLCKHHMLHWTSTSDHPLSSAAFSTARAARRTVSCWWRFDHRALLLFGSTRNGSVALTACGRSDLLRTGPQGLAVGITRGFPELRWNLVKPCKARA